MKARLTVCIPAFNRPDLLTETLESLAWQDLKPDDFVVVISDDASERELGTTVDQYRDRLQIVYKRNSRNIGHLGNFEFLSQLCQTRYISFLPHDDILAPGQLARALSVFEGYEDTALVSSPIVVQHGPGSPQSSVHGMFLTADRTASYWEPFAWETTNWLALALINTPLSIIGSVFDHSKFSQCILWKDYPLWHDRLMLAEMALYGRVRSLPWVGGYNRLHNEQLNSRLAISNGDEFRAVSEKLLNLCHSRMIPVEEFWVKTVCDSDHASRTFFLRELNRALSPEVFGRIHKQCETRLARPIKFGGRLENLGMPKPLVTLLRKLNQKAGGNVA